jgi:Ser/Thr protein kinase RdoA (MazF antagonist)
MLSPLPNWLIPALFINGTDKYWSIDLPERPQLIAHTQDILTSYGLQGSDVVFYGTGLINATFLVTVAPGLQFILQRLNKLFIPEINRDIDILTRHLASKSARTQLLVPADNGDLWVEDESGAWRLLTFIPGVCFDMLAGPEQAEAAGRLLGSFHRDVADLKLELHTERLGVHDTQRHLRNLHSALEDCREHPNYQAVYVLAQEVLAEAAELPVLTELPDRLVHGDPKISNLVFDEDTGAGVCMIDLDTLAHMPLPLELGDAFRSWCNPRGEDTQRSEFRLDYFAGAVQGYASVSAPFLLPAEWRSFVPAARTIMVELAARFATDALREVYFGWNPKLFADRSAHNQVRAAGQLELHRSLHAQSDAAEEIVWQAFAPK